MIPKLKDIEAFLARLDLKTDRFPTLSEFKKKYREKMNLHPDKAGEESTEIFKEITEAARTVFQLITEHPELQTRPENDECAKLVKCFEKSNHVEYNKDNVVFLIEDELCDVWIESLKKRLGPSIPLEDKVGVQFKTLQLKIPKLTNEIEGSFFASVWYKPSDGRSKIMFQGKAHMAFISFLLPDVLKEVKKFDPKKKTLPIEMTTEVAPSFLNFSADNTEKEAEEEPETKKS